MTDEQIKDALAERIKLLGKTDRERASRLNMSTYAVRQMYIEKQGFSKAFISCVREGVVIVSPLDVLPQEAA